MVRSIPQIGWLLVGYALVSGCVEPLDTARQPAPRGTLGEELYQAVCERLGAQGLREDVTGASYHGVCHPDAAGGYAASVDRSQLPGLSVRALDVQGNQVSLSHQHRQRDYAVARVEAVAGQRDLLVEALDAWLPELTLPDPGPLDGTSQGCAAQPAPPQRLHDALASFLSELVPLHEVGTTPALTRALGELLGRLASDPAASQAISRLSTRKGYVSGELVLGLLRPLATYPRLFELGDALLRAVASGAGDTPGAVGPAYPSFEQWLASAREFLEEPVGAVPSPLTVHRPDEGVPQLSRPRTTAELIYAALAHTDPELASGPRTYLVERDARGLARVGESAAAKGRFVWGGDGLPVVGPHGELRTVDGASAPAPLAPQGGDALPRDKGQRAVGEDGQPLYVTVDLRASVAHGLVQGMASLLAPEVDGGEGALSRIAARLPLVLEDANREVAKATSGAPPVAGSLEAKESPLVDALYAVGTLLAQPETLDLLGLLRDVAAERPDLLGRTVDAVRQANALLDEYPELELPEQTTLIDELFDLLAETSREPGLLEDLIGALSLDHTRDAVATLTTFMRMRDHFTYYRDPHAPERLESLNGPVYNATVGGFFPPITPVDRSQPDTGFNRSILQRFLHLLHDAREVSVCTKAGAVAHARVRWPRNYGVTVPFDYPTNALVGPVCRAVGSRRPKQLEECAVLRLPDVALLLVDVLLERHEVQIMDECLRKVAYSDIAAVVGGADAFLQDISGIEGFRLRPNVPAVARLAYFQVPVPQWGGHPGDGYYPYTRRFLEGVMEPVGTRLCPLEKVVDPQDGRVLQLPRCERFEDTLRGRHPDALFPLETMNFLESVRPLAQAFGDHDRPDLVVELLDALHLHWGSERQPGVDCDPSVPRHDPRWCTQDGVSRFEPFLADVLEHTPLVRELGAWTKEMKRRRVTTCRVWDGSGACVKYVERGGLGVVADAMRAWVDPQQHTGLTDRFGTTSVPRKDGSLREPFAPVHLAFAAFEGLRESLDVEPGASEDLGALLSVVADRYLKVVGEEHLARFERPVWTVALPVWLQLLHQQLAAHCQRTGDRCTWPREWAEAASETLGSNLLSASVDLVTALNDDARASDELARVLAFMVDDHAGHTAYEASLAALLDWSQLAVDPQELGPLYPLVADALAPRAPGRDSPGLALAMTDALGRVVAPLPQAEGASACRSAIDPLRVLGWLLVYAVTPPGPDRRAPLLDFLQVIRQVNRVKPGLDRVWSAADVRNTAREMSELFLDEASGVEQLYSVLREATGVAP